MIRAPWIQIFFHPGSGSATLHKTEDPTWEWSVPWPPACLPALVWPDCDCQRPRVRPALRGHSLINHTVSCDSIFMLWIRIRKYPHHFGNLDLHPDPHPHQMKIRIWIKIYKLDPVPGPDPIRVKKSHPDPHQIKIRIRIRIRILIRVISRIRAWALNTIEPLNFKSL